MEKRLRKKEKVKKVKSRAARNALKEKVILKEKLRREEYAKTLVLKKEKKIRKWKKIKRARYLKRLAMLYNDAHYKDVNKDRPFHLAKHNHSKPLFSFIGPAIRDYFYESYYKSVYSKHIPFEIVFVGYKPPLIKMPPNFRYIETDVNLAQCLEIAAREAKGEYLIVSGDDSKYVVNFLKNLSRYCASNDMNKTFIYFGESVNLPYSHGFLLKKSIWHEMGGIDRRASYMGTYDFMGVLDMELRFLQEGFALCSAIECQTMEVESTLTIGDTGIKRAIKRAHENLGKNPLSFWDSDNKIRIPHLSFDDNDILIKNQGEE